MTVTNIVDPSMYVGSTGVVYSLFKHCSLLKSEVDNQSKDTTQLRVDLIQQKIA
jgi:hypothetical protein